MATLTGAVSLAVPLASAYGRAAALRYASGVAVAAAIQRGFLVRLIRRTGPEKASPADILTLGRADCGAVLAGLVASGVRDRRGPAGRCGFGAALIGATLLDWLDGPLARRVGPTRRGGVLDSEADSWLTLWCGAAAAVSGALPRRCMIPPLLRYAHPVLDLLRTGAPAGSPLWERATGAAQMALFLAALFPLAGDGLARWLARIAPLVSGAQAASILLHLALRLRGGATAADRGAARDAARRRIATTVAARRSYTGPAV